jgi:hypothetical protein
MNKVPSLLVIVYPHQKLLLLLLQILHLPFLRFYYFTLTGYFCQGVQKIGNGGGLERLSVKNVPSPPTFLIRQQNLRIALLSYLLCYLTQGLLPLVVMLQSKPRPYYCKGAF